MQNKLGALSLLFLTTKKSVFFFPLSFSWNYLHCLTSGTNVRKRMTLKKTSYLSGSWKFKILHNWKHYSRDTSFVFFSLYLYEKSKKESFYSQYPSLFNFIIYLNVIRILRLHFSSITKLTYIHPVQPIKPHCNTIK